MTVLSEGIKCLHIRKYGYGRASTNASGCVRALTFCCCGSWDERVVGKIVFSQYFSFGVCAHVFRFFLRSLSWICDLGKLEVLPIGKQNHLDTLTMHISVGKFSSAVANQCWKLFGEIVREIRRISRFCSPFNKLECFVAWQKTDKWNVGSLKMQLVWW